MSISQNIITQVLPNVNIYLRANTSRGSTTRPVTSDRRKNAALERSRGARETAEQARPNHEGCLAHASVVDVGAGVDAGLVDGEFGGEIGDLLAYALLGFG